MKRAAARVFFLVFFFAGGLFYFSPDRLCREFTLKSALLANVTALDVSLPGSEKKKEKKRKDLTGRLGSKFVWSTLMEHMCMGVRTALYKSGYISFFIRSD